MIREAGGDAGGRITLGFRALTEPASPRPRSAPRCESLYRDELARFRRRARRRGDAARGRRVEAAARDRRGGAGRRHRRGVHGDEPRRSGDEALSRPSSRSGSRRCSRWSSREPRTRGRNCDGWIGRPEVQLHAPALPVGGEPRHRLDGAGGAARSRRCWRPRPRRRAPPGRAGAPLLASPHLVPRVKRVIYLFQSGGPSQLDLFDYKPLLRTMNGEELPESIRMGQRLTGMTAHQKSFPMAGSQFDVRAARQERHLGQRAAAAHGADRRQAVHRPVDAHRSHQPRSRGDVRPDRIAAGRPSVDRRVALLRARLRERQPARRSSSCSRAPARATSRSTRGCGAAASCRRSTRACSSARGKDPVLFLNDPKGIDRDQPPADARHAAHARAAAARARARSGDRRAHRPVRDGLPHADGGARRDGSRRRARRRLRAVRRRRPASPAPTPPTACWRGAWPSATCASSSSITRAGISTATCPRTSGR